MSDVVKGLALEGKRVIVVGGSRGIGLAAVRAFVAEGAHVGVLSRDGQVAESAVSGLRSGPSKVVTATADVRDRSAVSQAIAEIVTELGGIDILVNTAVTANTPAPERAVSDYDAEELQLGIDVKVFGYLNAIAAVVPHLIEQRWGRIINTGASSVRVTGSRSRSARNAALSALSHNLADELGAHGITVNVVHPGFTATERFGDAIGAIAAAQGTPAEQVERSIAERTSIGRVPTADDVAAVIVFLASPRASAITGAALDAGGGIRGSITHI